MKKLFFLLILLYPFLLEAQQILNAGFENICPEAKTGLCNWELSWGTKDCCQQEISEGNAFMSISGKSENSVGFVEQEISIPQYDSLKIIRFSARIKTQEVKGRGAGLNIAFYDKEDGYITTKDMGGRYSESWLRGNQDWQLVEIITMLPKQTAKIKTGAIVYGKGQAHFDEFKLELLDLNYNERSELATSYIKEILDLIRKHSLYRDALDYDLLRKTALDVAGAAKNSEDCHLAVDYILNTLRDYGDNHSFFINEESALNLKNTDNSADAKKGKLPTVTRTDNIAFITMPGCHSLDSIFLQEYAKELQTGIQDAYSDDLKGFVLDLRPNDGGNMAPMIAGLGPLLDSGILGSLKDVNGEKEYWYYHEGTVYWDAEADISVPNPLVIDKKLPIAVLTGSLTGSSGEIVTISFIGNKNTRSFGASTMGLTTGNSDFELSDGAMLFLASTKMVDRFNRVYDSVVSPDEEIEKDADAQKDLVMERAVEWILGHY